jgi:endonuclease YncB( thermonuclease family)
VPPPGVARTLFVGLAGVVGGAALVTLGLTSDLFGRVPPPPSSISAPPAQVAVIDGDTLRLRETVVRLAGVRAPPRGEACRAGGGQVIDCGAQAAAVLGELVRAQDVACRLDGHDAMSRPLARCEAGGQSLNAAVVASGWARSGGSELAALEAVAKASHSGLWAQP